MNPNAVYYYVALKGAEVPATAHKGGKAEQAAAGSDPEKERLQKLVKTYEAEIASLKQQLKSANDLIAQLQTKSSQQAPASQKAATTKKEEDFDPFAEDDEEEEKERERLISERAAQHKQAKAASGKQVVLKSAVVIDVKPWDDETDMKALEQKVREISMDGLEWKASKLTPIGYGIKKLQISCHIEDEKVSVDDIQEKIQELEDYVQSTDIESFVKL